MEDKIGFCLLRIWLFATRDFRGAQYGKSFFSGGLRKASTPWLLEESSVCRRALGHVRDSIEKVSEEGGPCFKI